MAKAATAKLTNGQLYDEANALIWRLLRNGRLSTEDQSRLAQLEAEFASRPAEAA